MFEAVNTIMLILVGLAIVACLSAFAAMLWKIVLED